MCVGGGGGSVLQHLALQDQPDLLGVEGLVAEQRPRQVLVLLAVGLQEGPSPLVRVLEAKRRQRFIYLLRLFMLPQCWQRGAPSPW